MGELSFVSFVFSDAFGPRSLDFTSFVFFLRLSTRGLSILLPGRGVDALVLPDETSVFSSVEDGGSFAIRRDLREGWTGSVGDFFRLGRAGSAIADGIDHRIL